MDFIGWKPCRVHPIRMEYLISKGARILDFQKFLSLPKRFYSRVCFRGREYEIINERPFPFIIQADGTIIPDNFGLSRNAYNRPS
jgi:hypothetical protein